LSKKCPKIVKKLSKNFLVKNLSKMFVKNLSIICSFAQIVRRKRRRRLVAPRPGGDFVAPGNKYRVCQSILGGDCVQDKISIRGINISLGIIRALSAHSAAEFNISPGRWQHIWLVDIVSPKRWGKMNLNDCHTAWGNFKTLISSLHHYKNYAWLCSLFGFFKK
jgi:hypothetical protein